MPHRRLVIAIIAVLAVALLVPIIMLALAGAPPGAQLPRAASSDEPAAGAPLGVEDVGWVVAMPLFDGPPNSYSLQAGTLDAPAPVLDLQVPFGLDPNSNPGRVPAVGRVIGGSVVYVADDGHRASLRRVTIARDPVDEELAEVNEIVYSLAVAPDGTHAYLALGDRADPELDRGIVRVSLDGEARTELVYGPAPDARSEPAIVLAAIAPFQVMIDISPDGRHLVRYACAGPAGCASQVIDTATRDVTELGDRGVMGVAGGIVLAQHCAAECGLELIDLASGAREQLPAVQFEAAITLVDGRPRVAFVDLAGDGAVLRALDPVDGSVEEVFRAPAGSSLSLGVSGLAPGMSGPGRMSLPDGYVVVQVSGEDAGAIVEMHSVAIRLDGGDAVELPPLPFRPEFPAPQG